MTFEFKGAHPRIPRAKWYQIAYWHSQQEQEREAPPDVPILEEIGAAVIGDPIH